MIASLPMYDWPELREAVNAFWQALRIELEKLSIHAPAHLERNTPEEIVWLSPDLLLSQTCGYPFATTLKGKVRYVATPSYVVEGCNGPYCSSAIIVHKDSSLDMQSLAGAKLAFNSTCSLSGYRILIAMLGEPERQFAQTINTGSHRNSARRVADQNADIAAMDAICWHMLNRFEPQTANRLKVIAWSESYPALPMITARKTDDATLAALRRALKLVVAAPQNIPTCRELAIAGYEFIDSKRYEALSKLTVTSPA